MQASKVNKDRQNETVERHEGEHRQPQGQLHKEKHDHRNWYHQREEGLQFWKDQHVKRHQALREFLQFEPFSLEEDLDKALVPACALLDKLLDGVWRLFTSDKLVVVEDADARVCYAQAYAQVRVLRQTSLIPTAHLLHQVASHKDCVATER